VGLGRGSWWWDFRGLADVGYKAGFGTEGPIIIIRGVFLCGIILSIEEFQCDEHVAPARWVNQIYLEAGI
jgi:hypothetical protein